MIITLVRDTHTPNETLGMLTVNGRKWHSIERPWVPNASAPCGDKGMSCIPIGAYRLEKHSSEAHQNVWAMVNKELWVYHWPWEVPVAMQQLARTVCLIHPANWASELRGCIALGKDRTKDKSGHWMVTNSRDAVNELRTLIGTQLDLQLSIAEQDNEST